MSYDLGDLEDLYQLFELDFETRCEYAMRKWKFGVRFRCPSKCKLDVLDIAGSHIVWKGPCPICREVAVYGLTEFGGSLNYGEWHQAKFWDSGRFMFEKELAPLQSLWEWVSRTSDYPYKNTKPLFNRQKIVERLIDHDYIVHLREPIIRDRPLSIPARYDESFLWKVGVPGLRVRNVMRFAEYCESWHEISNLIAEHNSSTLDAVQGSLGNIEEEYLKELKSYCAELKHVDRAEGEGAFKLLSHIRQTARRLKSVS